MIMHPKRRFRLRVHLWLVPVAGAVGLLIVSVYGRNQSAPSGTTVHLAEPEIQNPHAGMMSTPPPENRDDAFGFPIISGDKPTATLPVTAPGSNEEITVDPARDDLLAMVMYSVTKEGRQPEREAAPWNPAVAEITSSLKRSSRSPAPLPKGIEPVTPEAPRRDWPEETNPADAKATVGCSAMSTLPSHGSRPGGKMLLLLVLILGSALRTRRGPGWIARKI